MDTIFMFCSDEISVGDLVSKLMIWDNTMRIPTPQHEKWNASSVAMIFLVNSTGLEHYRGRSC